MSLKFEKATSIQQMDSGGGSGGQTINNQDLTITENGVYTAEEGYTGIGTATVDVQPNLISKTVTENGTYRASDDNADGYSTVTTNVPQKGIIFKTINGTSHISLTGLVMHASKDE